MKEGIAHTLAAEVTRPSLKLSALSNWVTFCVNVIVGLLVTPYVIAHVGKEGYGIWTLVISFIGYFGLLRLGVGSAIARYMPFYLGRDEKDKVCGVFSTAVVIYLLAGLMVLVVGVVAAGIVTAFFRGNTDFKSLLMLVAVSAALDCPSAVLDAAIRANERYFAANCVEVVLALARTLALVIVLHLGYGVIGIGWITVGTTCAHLGLNAVVLRRACPHTRFAVKTVNIAQVRQLLSYGAMAMAINLGFLVRYQSDKVVIGRFMDMRALGIYAIAASLMLYYRNAIGATSRVFYPRFAYLDGMGRHSEALSLFLRSTRMSASIASGIAAMLLVVGGSFVRLWVGSDFSEVLNPLFILTVAYLVDQSQTMTISLLGGYGKQGLLVVLGLVEGLAAVVLSIVLIQVLGLTGVAIGLAIPMVVVQALVRPFYVCRFLGITMWQYYRRCLLTSWAIAGAVCLALLPVKVDAYVDSWVKFIAVSLAIFGCYCLASYRFVLDAEERSALVKGIEKYFYAACPWHR